MFQSFFRNSGSIYLYKTVIVLLFRTQESAEKTIKHNGNFLIAFYKYNIVLGKYFLVDDTVIIPGTYTGTFVKSLLTTNALNILFECAC